MAANRSWWAWAALGLALGGCRQLLGLDDGVVVEVAGDAAQSDGAPADSADDAPLDGDAALPPWSAPTKVPNTTDADSDPSLSPDLLELYFSHAGGSNNIDIYVMKRATLQDSWGAPTRELTLSSPGWDSHPSLSPDGLTIYYSREVNQHLVIYRATRASAQEAWTNVARVDQLTAQGAYDVFAGSPTVDGTRLVFAANTSLNAPANLYEASRTNASDQFTTITALPFNTSGVESGAHLSPDGLTLYFHGPTPNAFDLYVTTRSSLTDPWSAPTVWSELSVANASDHDPWVSSDGRVVYFASDRAGGGIFFAQR